MNKLFFDFMELKSDKSFKILRRKLTGNYLSNGVLLENTIIKGEIIKRSPEEGLLIRKWEVVLIKKGSLQKERGDTCERKCSLVHLLHPSLFNSTAEQKNFPSDYGCNKLLLSNNVKNEFGHLPKQSFYVMEVIFSVSWLTKQIEKEKRQLICALEQLRQTGNGERQIEHCLESGYKLLSQPSKSLNSAKNHLSIDNSKIYQSIFSFFHKLVSVGPEQEKKSVTYYEQQLVVAEAEISRNLLNPLKLETIARMVNMSQSSLLRQFKSKYGKSLQAYYIEQKMELARKIILNKKISVRKISELFGYTHPSHFIEIFMKQFGCSPGILKTEKSFRHFFSLNSLPVKPCTVENSESGLNANCQDNSNHIRLGMVSGK